MKNKLNVQINKHFAKIFALLMIIGMLNLVSFGQAAQRIRFAKGKSSKTIKGTTSTYGKDFVIDGRRGQELKVKVVSPNGDVRISVNGSGIGDSLTVRLQSSDDYEFSVYVDDVATSQATSKYTMSVSIK